MKTINIILNKIPISLWLSVVVINILFTYSAVVQNSYDSIYYYMNEILNTSILTNVFILLACYRYKFCLYNKVSVFGLLAMNGFNLIFMSLNLEYEAYNIYCMWFTHAIMIPLAILSIILMIKKI